MNHSIFKFAFLLLGVYAASFGVTAATLRSSGEIGVTAPGLAVARLPAAREFSDAVHIPGTNRILIVEDETWDSVLAFRIAAPGDTDGSAEEIGLPAGFYLKDMEGIAMDARGFVYVVSSHSLNSAGKPRRGSALARMRLTAAGTFADAETIADLRPWLETAIPEIAAVTDLQSDSGGLNIEGLAYDPGSDRLLLGLRGPLFGRHPALVPIRIIKPGGPFTRANMDMHAPIVLESIDNFGIRSISYDVGTRGYWILSGGGGVSALTKNRFHVWFWSGEGNRPERMNQFSFKKKIGRERFPLRPEGICAVRPPEGPAFLLIVTDGSPYYLKTGMPNPS